MVTHPLSVQEIPVQSPAPSRVLCLIFCFVVVVFLLFLSKNTLFVTEVCYSFYNFKLFSIP